MCVCYGSKLSTDTDSRILPGVLLVPQTALGFIQSKSILMRAVIILCTGPDNPANRDNCEIKKPNTLHICSAGVLCCSFNHRTPRPTLVISRL